MSRKLKICFALVVALLTISENGMANCHPHQRHGGSRVRKGKGGQMNLGDLSGLPGGMPVDLSEIKKSIPFNMPDDISNILSPTATPTVAPTQKGIPQPSTAVQSTPAAASPSTDPSDGKNVCRSYTENFQNTRIVSVADYNNDPSSADWINLSGTSQTYSLNGGVLNMNLLPPDQYLPTENDQGKFNKKLGMGLTLNSTYLIHYGTISAKIKTSPLGGVVTAFISMSPNGDEIDWEYVGGDLNHVQSNWYWNGLIEWGIHGGVHNVSAPQISDAFHEYSINWQPNAITWAVDGVAVRTLLANDTAKNGTTEFPNHPSYIQFGIWDGSGAPGTANWSNGPIDWSKQTSHPLSQISEVKIDCDPTYNHVIS